MTETGPAIAVVGLGCRYPDARGPGELWENVLSQRRAFRRIPAERLRLEDYFSESGSSPDTIYSSRAAVIEGYEFDRLRFRIGERSFRSADLAHWLALDVASQALEDAGFPDGKGLAGDATGVLLGNTLTGEFSRARLLRLRWPYVRRQVGAALAAEGWSGERREAFLGRLEESYKQPFPATDEETLAGGLSNTIAGRICNHFDFHGGGYTVDGACSSSLLAVANACTAISAGDLDVALAGGVDLSLDPFELVGFARTGALARGEMRVYDRRSDGFIPGEGCGFLVLMRHRDAVDQGRRVYAVVRGWGLSSDGAGGLTRPEAGGQILALRRAYRRAGFGIESIGLVEGHGTGTAVGDAAELAALNRFRRQSGARVRATIGSIKANIGHTKAAAGAAGTIKAAMALHHRLLPPTTGCQEPHPELVAEDTTLRVSNRPRRWPKELPPRASVSSMGFGGINCHLVLEGGGEARRRSFTAVERRLSATPQDAEVVLLAAADEAALEDLLQGLARRAGKLALAELADLAAGLARKLPARPGIRAAVVAATPHELEERLETLRGWLVSGIGVRRLDVAAGVFAGRAVRAPRIGFLFPGQGSPARLGGGRWRRRFAEAGEVYRQADPPPSGDGVETAVAQPAITTAALAALAVLDRIGIEAVAAVGHSLGELVALHWAGAFDRGAVLRLAGERGLAMSELGDSGGAMASLGADASRTEELLAALAPETVAVTGYNSPSQTVISGTAAAVDAAVAAARQQGLMAQRLPVSHAFHSPQVAAAVPRLDAALSGERIAAPGAAVYSTITGARLEADEDLRRLLCRQITSPVRFTEALAAAAAEVDLLLEVGPGEVLSRLARQQTEVPAVALDAGGDSLRGLLSAVGAAFALGTRLDAEALFADRFTRPFDFEREPSFFVNPCELAPVDGALPPRAVAAETPGDRDSRAVAPPPEAASPLAMIRELIARRAELPLAAITDDSRLLSDLHMSSIAVGELVTTAARGLDLPPPFAPTEYADATVAEVARALEEMRAAGGGASPAATLPAGIDAWVRAFTVEHVERPLPRSRPAETSRPWRVFAAPGTPLREPLERAFAEAGGAGGVVLCLPSWEAALDGPGDGLDVLLEAAGAALGERSSFLLVQPGAGAAAFVRTLHLEAPEMPVAVIDLPAQVEDPDAWCRRAVAEALAVRRYAEARYDARGRRFQPVLRPLETRGPEGSGDEPAAAVLAPDDVLLVTGGGKGIGAECALALARRTGARLALLGRSAPESDDELRANLERFAGHGVRFAYRAADVTDGEEVAAAVRGLESELGQVRAVLHAAGANVPKLIGALERADVERTLAPKVGGLRRVLAAVGRERLKLLVGFGSIIGRAGLRGEADYALANDRLRQAIEGFAAETPGCRCLCIEWSVWSGTGMGARLGSLETLVHQGITPIAPEQGVAMLEELVLGSTAGPVSVVVTGRFGEPPTLEVERPELPLRRFLEKPRVVFPGIELVVDCELSKDSDPYLAEHLFEGSQLFPAVMGLEAMAQAVAALTGTETPPVFADVRFERPINVAPEGSTTLRVAALARRSGEIEVALRSDHTGFQIDHFRARCLPAPDAAAAAPAAAALRDGELLRLSPSAELYGPVLFQAGRFQRVGGYRELRATACLAQIEPNPDADWFHRYLPDALVLGDPGARDAFIHCIQACIPHATVLPVSVQRLVAGRIAGRGSLQVTARERSQQGRTLVYDVEVHDSGGVLVESWQRLELRAVGELGPPPRLAPLLLGPYLQRRFQELVPGAALAVAVDRGGHEDRQQRGALALGQALGIPAEIRHRPDGKPQVNGNEVSIAHSGELVLAVAGHGAVGCDVEPVESRTRELWDDLLGSHRHELLELLIRERGEDRDAAATRIWTVLESLKKAGYMNDAPLTYSAATADGWVLFDCGRHKAASVLLTPSGSDQRFSFAVLAGRGGEEEGHG
jgi:enediyne polyketide synthase